MERIMLLEDGVAAVMMFALIAYGVLGGADFGGGIWDLLASGPRKKEQRAAVARAIGPVWEANHVWLIFVIVLLFAGFPQGYAALSIALFVPFHLALVGITLRGAAFVFRGYGPRGAHAQQRFGAIFGAASVVTPLLLGMCMGAVSSGTSAWLSPEAQLLGLLALCLCAYLAAVYLTIETRDQLQEDFRRKALLSGTLVVALSAIALPLIHVHAPHLWLGLLLPRSLPVLSFGTLAALLSGWGLLRRRYRLARACAILQVASLLCGWGLAQYPYLIYPDITLSGAAAPAPTLTFLLLSLIPGGALLLPSLWLLFQVFKGWDQA